MKHFRIAIVGAGMAGLACARHLNTAGLAVELFDKANRPGGRMASRQLALAIGTTRIDHGAQYFTARDSRFKALCTEAQGAGVLVPWTGELRDERLDGGIASTGEPRYRGDPDMNALPCWLAQGLAVHCDAAVTGLRREPDGWSLAFADGPEAGGFEAIAVALPAEQAVTLLEQVSPALATEAGRARNAPCWAGLFAFASSAHWPAWQALRPAQGHPLGWLARSRDGNGLVAHATPDWSREHLETPASEVEIALLAAVRDCAPGLGAPERSTVHRWRYALVEQAAGSPCALDPALALGVCGDWRLGPRVELAWISGDALGAALARLLEGRVQA